MKVCVFGDDRNDCIEIANRLNDRGVTALIGGEVELKEIVGKVGRGFDCAILLSDDPIKAAVQANRDPRIRAAACYDQKSLRTAASDNVNMLIMEPESMNRLDFSIIAGRSTRQAEEPEEPDAPAPGPGRGILKAFASMAPKPRQPVAEEPERRPPKEVEKPQKKREQKRPAAEDDQDEGEGFAGRIKDIFGIEE